MPASKQIAFQHAFNGVLTEEFNHASVPGQLSPVHILGEVLLDPELLAGLVDGVEFVRSGLIGTKNPEIRHICLHDVTQKRA